MPGRIAQRDWRSGLAANAFNAAIDSAAASIIVHSPSAGLVWVVYHLFIQAEAVTDLTFRSAATNLSGPIHFLQGTEKGWADGGSPVMRGINAGDDFIIVNANSIQLNGWALMGVNRTA